jgi:hypothetical protein
MVLVKAISYPEEDEAERQIVISVCRHHHRAAAPPRMARTLKMEKTMEKEAGHGYTTHPPLRSANPRVSPMLGMCSSVCVYDLMRVTMTWRKRENGWSMVDDR